MRSGDEFEAYVALQAAHWRTTTRSAFQWAPAHRYTVTHFAHDGDPENMHCLLTLRPSPHAPAAP